MTRTGMKNPVRMAYDMTVAQDYSPKWRSLYSAYPKLEVSIYIYIYIHILYDLGVPPFMETPIMFNM